MNPFTTHQLAPGVTLPLVIQPVNPSITVEGVFDLLKTYNAELKGHLLKHGGLLFRNFPIKNANDFAALIHHISLGEFSDYKGGDSPRTKIVEGIFTSTEAPPSLRIPLHNELSYAVNYPSHIFFYCDIEPVDKGQTPIADARKVFNSIDPEVREKFIQKGLIYHSSYHGGSGLVPALIGKGHRSWKQVFETSNPEEVEKICRERGMELEWHHDGWLTFKQTRPATHIHKTTGEKVWFNQAHIYKLSPRFLGWWRYLGAKMIYFRPHTLLHDVEFGDGTPIPSADLEHIMDKLEENSIYFPWRKGDVLVLDNILAMHGRAPFSGKRRILTAMTSM